MTKLSDSLAASMILDDQPMTLRVEAATGALTSDQAVSMGLIVTELVINALKHAFPHGGDGAIVVRYRVGPDELALNRLGRWGGDNQFLDRAAITERPRHEHRRGAHTPAQWAADNDQYLPRRDSVVDRSNVAVIVTMGRRRRALDRLI